jgi:hypothetical protein
MERRTPSREAMDGYQKVLVNERRSIEFNR